MRASVFSDNLLVLANGIPMEEMKISSGLMQGDLLAPFCFIGGSLEKKSGVYWILKCSWDILWVSYT